MQLLDLEGASEFILLAATLIRIKAKMLLPRPKPEDDDEIIDPRMELVTRLLEYKRFKEVAYKFGELEEERGKLFNRKYFEEIEEKSDEGFEISEDVSLFTLILILKMKSWTGSVVLMIFPLTLIFDDLSWSYIFPVYLSFLIGILFYYAIRNKFRKSETNNF